MKKELWDEGLLTPKQPPREDRGRRILWRDLNVLLVLGLFLFYPFALAGAVPFGIVRLLNQQARYRHIDDRDYQDFLKRGSPFLWGASVLLVALNITLFFTFPQGYFSTYLLFPLNFIPNTLHFTLQTLLALWVGGVGMCLVLLSVSTFYDKWRVQSKETQREKILSSTKYQKRKADKFRVSQTFTKDMQEDYFRMLELSDYTAFKKEFERLKAQILIGTDEFGHAVWISLKELVQHTLIQATTGGGKTILLQLFVEHCIKFHIPCVLIDGKGSKDTLEAMEQMAEKYGKKVIAFSDTHTVRYNPIKHGNSTEIKDRLVTLAETESVFYTGAAKSLLMGSIQLLDHFGIARTFSNLSHYFLPRNVLRLFSDQLEKEGVEVFVEYRPIEKKKVPKGTSKGATATVNLEIELEPDTSDDEDVVTEIATTKIVYDPDKISLDDYYGLIRRQFNQLPLGDQKLFEQLFMRYEYKDSVFYLYATSEALQTNINMLLDSEVGGLFETQGCEQELDLLEIYRKKQVVYISLNGLIYDEFIKQLAHFIVGDIKHLMSEIYQATQEKQEMFALFDEPASYLDDSFIAVANKARGAGLHAFYSPQTLADIEQIDPTLVKQLIGNVNTVMVGQTNESKEVGYWAEYFGTYKDIDITEMTEQASGMNNMDRTSWTGERGTKRDVHKFEVPADDIKALRTGEFYVLRKGNNVHEPIRKVYVRDAMKS